MSAGTFHVLDVVTVAKGVLVAPSHMDAVYKLCGHMLGDDNLFTHQLPAAATACQGALHEQFPWLTDLHVPESLVDATTREEWCAQIVTDRGELVDVEPIADPQWVRGRALTDLVQMMSDRSGRGAS